MIIKYGVFVVDKKKLIKRCLKFKDAIETYPFKDKSYEDYAVLRHKSNNKWFGLVFYLDGKLCINLKAEPYDAMALRDMYSYVTPAWHMNKKHWIMVDVENADLEVLSALIENSYNLTL